MNNSPELQPHRYDFTALEAKWQQRWEDQQTFHTPNPGHEDFDATRPKFYVLDMFPYPSGVGLHVGHPLGYIATDIVGRYKRMRGFNVLHPMGFDAFGLPAEQYAVEHNVHPRITTQQNLDNMVRQLKQLGLGYDWSRCLATTDPGYVKWTQWIFLQLYQSYFDPLLKKALPIEQLIAKLQGEDYYIGTDGELIVSGIDEDLDAVTGGTGKTVTARKWYDLDADQQSRLLDEYRLAYMADVEVNWCPGLGTVLANEEVTNDGRSERGNFPVHKRPLKQWMLRITAYNDRLIDDLDLVSWPEPVKILQRNWIGKSHGAQVDFKLAPHADAEERSDEASGSDEAITVFTTRPDTLFGATYMVLAPEHPLTQEITTDDQRQAVEQYRQQATEKTSVQRQAAGGDKEKTGVFTGAHAINPVNNQPIPIWIADYVMMGYGTGAIMAVPAHDPRDFAFAQKFDLPILEVITGGNVKKQAHTGNGKLTHSDFLDGLSVPDAQQKINAWLEEHHHGHATVNFKLRDWLFSRQRYWGEPFPILHGPDGEIVTLDESELPLELPEMDDFKPHPPENADDPNTPPRPPLGRADESWRIVERDGVRYTRELNTMPNWAGSCWYYLRYLDPQNENALVNPTIEKYWMTSKKTSGDPHAGGVDLYVGGIEHAVLHLLYARFWHKVLHDLGHVSTPEPFGKLFNQGYIQAFYYEDEQGVRVEAADVLETHTNKPAGEVQDQPAEKCAFTYEGRPVQRLYGKMGKSLKNAVAPDDICEQYGCDTLRLYEMSMGPLDQSKVWNTADIVGVHRFLNRLWRNFINDATGHLKVSRDNPTDELNRLTHKTIKRVSEAMDNMAFNVAIAALIELNNALVPLDAVPQPVANAMAAMLAPLAPHIAEELWERLGHHHPNDPVANAMTTMTTMTAMIAPHFPNKLWKRLGHRLPNDSVADAEWPEYNPALLVEDTITLPVQVNGKLRGKITVPQDADQDTLLAAAKLDENVALHLENKTLRKAIVIPKKLINLVVG